MKQVENDVRRFGLSPEGLMDRHQQLTKLRHRGGSPWDFPQEELRIFTAAAPKAKSGPLKRMFQNFLR